VRAAFASEGARVVIAPGIVLSERVGGRMQVDFSDALKDQIDTALENAGNLVSKRHPFGFGMPEDIAPIALFLASGESRMVNAAVIPAQGGASFY
jgi:NAD(P)-dependent dehydrogenase (short-subunit alcohol dehydrogenase family)|tara:strand:+ start:1202 stop:1486 length:285 start_codon:yes stop_codon:yes gene_type:complete